MSGERMVDDVLWSHKDFSIRETKQIWINAVEEDNRYKKTIYERLLNYHMDGKQLGQNDYTNFRLVEKEVIRYKTCVVTKAFIQIKEVYYTGAYSSVTNTITSRTYRVIVNHSYLHIFQLDKK